MNFRLFAISIAITICAGCAVQPSVSKVQVEIPQNWNEGAIASTSTSLADTDTWWAAFGSEELNRLVAIALSGSPDLAVAAQRIRQAEATVGSTGASLFPSLNASLNSGRRKSTADGIGNVSDSTGATLGISYEIDLWGRLDANFRAANASLKSSKHDFDTVRVTLISGVANAYFQLLATRARLDIARNNLAIAEELLRIVDVRYRNGAASALDLSRQQTAVLTQRAALQPLEVQERQTVSALAVLLGQTPQGFQVSQVNGNDLLQPAIPQIAAGLPSAVLTRRPDLARAEAQLAAADANLDAARAALLPGLQLSGSGGLASSALLSLASPAKTWALTASVSQAIFDGGRLRSQVQISDAQRLQLLETYRKAILTALKEVEDALSNVGRYRDQESAQTGIRDEAQRSLQLAELRYREGAMDLTSVLDAQRTLYAAQDQLAQIRLSRLNSAVELVKALGGSTERNKTMP